MTGDGPLAVGAPHATALAVIHEACFPGEPWSADSIAALFGNEATFGFLDPRGGLVLARAVADEAEILTIGVAPALRRAGIGRVLLDAALGEAAGRGARTVFLEVDAGNSAAIGLYRSAGFGEAGRRRDYYGPGRDALLLSRRLCESPG